MSQSVEKSGEPVEVTEAAAEQALSLIEQEGYDTEEAGLRLFVQQGGCAGLSYGLRFDIEPERTTLSPNTTASESSSTRRVKIHPRLYSRFRGGAPGERLRRRKPERRKRVRLWGVVPDLIGSVRTVALRSSCNSITDFSAGFVELLRHTGIRLGALHALDVDDYREGGRTVGARSPTEDRDAPREW